MERKGITREKGEKQGKQRRGRLTGKSWERKEGGGSERKERGESKSFSRMWKIHVTTTEKKILFSWNREQKRNWYQ